MLAKSITAKRIEPASFENCNIYPSVPYASTISDVLTIASVNQCLKLCLKLTISSTFRVICSSRGRYIVAWNIFDVTGIGGRANQKGAAGVREMRNIGPILLRSKT